MHLKYNVFIVLGIALDGTSTILMYVVLIKRTHI